MTMSTREMAVWSTIYAVMGLMWGLLCYVIFTAG